MKLTRARRDALYALAGQGTARVSNRTEADPVEPTVYWQTAAWLVDAGLATTYIDHGEYLVLTGAGVRQVNALGEQLTLIEPGDRALAARSGQPLPAE